MLTGFILGIIVMSICAMLGIVFLDRDNNVLGTFLLGPAGWLFAISVTLYEFIYVKLIKGTTMFQYKLDELKKTNVYYKPLFKNYHMFRFYGDKKKHPILYHLIVIEKLKIIGKH